MPVDRRTFLALAASAAGLGAAPPVLRDVPVSGAADPELAPFDALMKSFLTRHGVPGAALAVTRGGRLVYARGFGVADTARKTPVQPDALFRVASVSKPITAVAVMRLVERKK